MILDKVKMIINCFFLRNKVHIGRHSQIDKSSRFEGKNSIAGNCSFINSSIGFASYIANGCFIRNTKIGRYCCIGKNVRIIDVTHPTKDYVSIHPLFFADKTVVGSSYVKEKSFEEFIWHPKCRQYSVIIENDVWIGDGAAVLGGHTIGNGAIIAAGAVVTKDVEPYTIVAGVPARKIGCRFEESDVEFLQQLRWWDRKEPWIANHAEYFRDIELLKTNMRTTEE